MITFYIEDTWYCMPLSLDLSVTCYLKRKGPEMISHSDSLPKQTVKYSELFDSSDRPHSGLIPIQNQGRSSAVIRLIRRGILESSVKKFRKSI